MDLMGTQGFEAMTLDGLARHAGVSKATLYRWWSSKEDVAVEAIESFTIAPPFATLPERGGTETLLEIVLILCRNLSPAREMRVLAQILAASASHPRLARVWRERVVRPRFEAVERALRAAMSRGELPSNAPIDVAADAIVGALFYRRLVRGETLAAPALAEQLVQMVWQGMQLSTSSRSRA
jgi:AcrR family transcriptional regulator